MLGKVKNPPLHALLPTTNLLLFLFETCSSVSLFIRGIREGQKQNKDWGDKPGNHVEISLGNGEEMSKVIHGV